VYIFNEYKKILLLPYLSTVTYLPLITYFNSKLIFVLIEHCDQCGKQTAKKACGSSSKSAQPPFPVFSYGRASLAPFSIRNL